MRTPKRGKHKRKAHFLLTQRRGNTLADGNKVMKEPSQTEEHQGRDLSGHRENVTSEGHSLPGDGRGRDSSGHRMKLTEKWGLTS